jgi:hypothetical protein
LLIIYPDIPKSGNIETMTKNHKIHRVVKEISRGLNYNSYEELTSNRVSIFNNHTTKLYVKIRNKKKSKTE